MHGNRWLDSPHWRAKVRERIVGSLRLEWATELNVSLGSVVRPFMKKQNKTTHKAKYKCFSGKLIPLCSQS